MPRFRATLLLLLGLTLFGCRREPTAEEQGALHLAALRQAGLLAGKRGSTQVLDVRLVSPKATRLGSSGEPLWWATLQTDDGEAGYLAWRAGGDRTLVDFSLEGLTDLSAPQAVALPGVPPIQQFSLRGPDGKPVASGCVPTAAASLVAYWSNRGTYDWQADDSHEGLTMRLRDRLPMQTIPDLAGFTDGKMALAGTSAQALVAGLKEDAAQYKVAVAVTLEPFAFVALRQEVAAGRPALVTCGVPVPRKPELSWGHAVVAVGFAEVDGRPFVAVVDNYLVVRAPGTLRWIAAERCREIIFVRPVR
jgi:hypothetical protein